MISTPGPQPAVISDSQAPATHARAVAPALHGAATRLHPRSAALGRRSPTDWYAGGRSASLPQNNTCMVGFAVALPPTPAAGCITEPQRDDDVRPWACRRFGRAVVSVPCAPPTRPGHLPTSEAS